jgi:hypothetical protein
LFVSKNIQKSIRKWIDVGDWNHPFAATLTLKQSIGGDGGVSSASERLTVEAASRNARHFLNVLNKRIFGPAAFRYQKRVPVVAVLEGTAAKRFHYHLIIDCPRDSLIEEFPTMIRSSWMKTVWGYKEMDVRPCDVGWLDYMTKLKDKTDFASSIDWLNCHLPKDLDDRNRWV